MKYDNRDAYSYYPWDDRKAVAAFFGLIGLSIAIAVLAAVGLWTVIGWVL